MFRTALLRSARQAVRTAPRWQAPIARPVARSSLFQAKQITPSARFQAVRCYASSAGLSKDEVEGRIMDLLKNFDKVTDTSKLNGESHFHNDLGLDSLDTVAPTYASWNSPLGVYDYVRHSTLQSPIDLPKHTSSPHFITISIISKMVSYHITEPHPSAPAPTIYYGRGGAGNVTRVPKNITSGQDASGPASRIKLSPPPSNALFTSGRGGAGNMHREKERAMFSFDEELAQQERLREHAAPVYHIGRGGAGNLVAECRKTSRQNSSSSTMSSDSERGVRGSIEGAWHKVSRQFSRN